MSGSWLEAVRGLAASEGLWRTKDLTPVPLSRPSRFLIYSPVPWDQGHLERMISLALRLRGHHVDEIICGGDIPACGMEHADVLRPNCTACHTHALDNFAAWGLPTPASTADFLSDGDRSLAASTAAALNLPRKHEMELLDFLPLQFEGLPLGKRIYEQAYWHLSANFSDPDLVEEVLRKCAEAYVLNARAAAKALSRANYDALLLCNAKTIESGPVFDVARSLGIRTVDWEELFIFDTNSPCVDFLQEGVWEVVKNQPLTGEEKRRTANYMKLWKDSKNTPFRFYESPIDDTTAIRDHLKLRSDAFTICLFSNVTDDSSVIGRHKAFVSLYDWVRTCCDFASANPDVECIIRSHPVERFRQFHNPSRVFIADAVRAAYGDLPHNIHLVESNSQISSYALLHMSDISSTYTGTLSLEAPLLGRLCAVAGDCHYQGKGFTVDINTKDSFLQLLQTRSPLPLPTQAQVEAAWRYAHYCFLRLRAKPDFYVSDTFSWRIPTLSMFAPGGHVFIENLCDSLINDRAFLDLTTPNRRPIELAPLRAAAS